tara:strand:+ start:1862 stop:3016 length:1155 start_codon:yes stop_codon:yes gene_type:complete
MVASKLIFKGSSGCVFRPQLKCKNKTKKKNNKVTKLMFDKHNREYDFNNILRKINNYKKWTVLWEEVCESEPYGELSKTSDIDRCLMSRYAKEDVKAISNDHSFILYQGDYGGETIEQYCIKHISNKILSDQIAFNNFFKEIFRLLKNVFYGLVQLNKYGICHHDITIRNILVKKKESFIIDYDISLLNNGIEQNQYLKKRMKNEYTQGRLYEAYPFEYIYYHLNSRAAITKEQESIKSYQHLINYNELYHPINNIIYNIDTDQLRYELLQSKKPTDRRTSKQKTKTKNSTSGHTGSDTKLKKNPQSLVKLMEKLDVYSLGMMIFILLIDAGNRLNVTTECITDRFRDPGLKSYMELLKQMIAFNYEDRISISEAYEKYLNLIR